MAKKIPLKINPDTIAKVIFQIRHSLNIPETELLGRLYPILHEQFPKLEQKNTGVPTEIIRMDPQLRYLANYAFSNDYFSVGFGANVLSFEYLTGYKGWNDFYQNIQNVLQKADSLDIFRTTERIGLRYVNLIGEEKSIDHVIDFKLKLNLNENYIERNTVFRKEFNVENAQAVLQIVEGATLKTKQEIKKGILIDLDVSISKDLPRVGSQLLKFVSELHEKEKFIFFNVLKQEFIDSLNPSY